MPGLRSPSIPSLRRALFTQGFTPRPICPRCHSAVAPKAFDPSGVCQACARATTIREGWLPSLHNNCATDQAVRLVAVAGQVRIAKYPERCRGCGASHPMTPEYSPAELQAAWVVAAEG